MCQVATAYVLSITRVTRSPALANGFASGRVAWNTVLPNVLAKGQNIGKHG